MAKDGTDELGEILAAYDKKKELVDRSASAKASQTEKTKEDCGNLVFTQVQPTLRAWSERMTAAGHESSIGDNNDGGLPSVVLFLAPGHPSARKGSSIQFACQQQQVIYVRPTVEGKAQPQVEWTYGEVGPGNMTKVLSNFVRSVLNASLATG